MLLLPILAGVAFFLAHSSRTLQNQAVRDLNATLSLQQQFIEQWVHERAGDIDYLAADPRVRSLPPQAVGALFQRIVGHAPAFSDIVYVDETGLTKVDPRRPAGINLSDREYFLAASKGEKYISDVLDSRLTGEKIFVVSSPVKDAQGRFRGLVLGAVSLKALSTLMQTVQDESSGRTFLTRAGGELIAPGEGPGFRPGDTLFERAKAEISSRGIYRNADGKRVVGTYQWVLDGKWLLAGERTEIDILSTHAWVLGVPLAGAALVFLIFGPMALRLAGSLDAPLKRLEEHARQIEAGNFDVDCTPLPMNGVPEEVRRLNQAYCLMVERVRGALDALQEASYTDYLTGAANRKQLYQVGPRLLDAARRAGLPVSLLMLDLDNFKRVNDTYGHAAGDAVLAGFSALLRSTLRKSDLFARYGGEEFVVLAPNAGNGKTLELAERIRAAVERLEVPSGEGVVRFTVSIGASTLEGPPPGPPGQGYADTANAVEPLEALLAQADEALYAAKAAGRNRVEAYPSVPAAARI
jgi:two-component system, cell cycle response regulator